MPLVTDNFETTFLALTIAYYVYHLRKEVRHAWHRLRMRVRRIGLNRGSAKVVLGTVLMFFAGSCMQSGPVLLYGTHFIHKVYHAPETY